MVKEFLASDFLTHSGWDINNLNIQLNSSDPESF